MKAFTYKADLAIELNIQPRQNRFYQSWNVVLSFTEWRQMNRVYPACIHYVYLSKQMKHLSDITDFELEVINLLL